VDLTAAGKGLFW